MGIKIVVLDGARLPEGVDFPPLEVDKYGWEQYPQLAPEELAERCWRADIVVSLGTAIDAPALEKMMKIGLLICAGEACSHIDQEVVRIRGIELLAFLDEDFRSVEGAQDLCNRVSSAIDHYIRTFSARGKAI